LKKFFNITVPGNASKTQAVRRTDFNEKDHASPSKTVAAWSQFDPTNLFEAKAKPHFVE